MMGQSVLLDLEDGNLTAMMMMRVVMTKTMMMIITMCDIDDDKHYDGDDYD